MCCVTLGRSFVCLHSGKACPVYGFPSQQGDQLLEASPRHTCVACCQPSQTRTKEPLPQGGEICPQPEGTGVPFLSQLFLDHH